MFVDNEKCKELGLDAKKIESIARRLSKAALEAAELGLHIFGGSGKGTLRIKEKGNSGLEYKLTFDLYIAFNNG